MKFSAIQHTVQTLHLGNFHFLVPLKKAFGGRRFADDDEVKEVMHVWLCIRKLMDRWTEWVQTHRDYIEK
jgi:hypothetical protein